MKTASDILAEFGIRLRAERHGNQKTVCPNCSHLRKHKRDPCLSVLIDGEGVFFNCKNCSWKGGKSYDAQEREFMVTGALAHEDGSIMNATAYIRGRLIKNDHGSWKPGEVGENDFQITLRYYRLEVDGRTLIEMTPFDVSIGGVSQTAAIRSALLA